MVAIVEDGVAVCWGREREVDVARKGAHRGFGW